MEASEEVRVVVTRAYARPFENPISVRAGDVVMPDFDRPTDIPGWVWCTARDGRGGWTPTAWLVCKDGGWHIERDFNAIELTVVPGEVLEVLDRVSGFLWVRRGDGETGWVPCDHVGRAESFPAD